MVVEPVWKLRPRALFQEHAAVIDQQGTMRPLRSEPWSSAWGYPYFIASGTFLRTLCLSPNSQRDLAGAVWKGSPVASVPWREPNLERGGEPLSQALSTSHLPCSEPSWGCMNFSHLVSSLIALPPCCCDVSVDHPPSLAEPLAEDSLSHTPLRSLQMPF